MAPGQPSKKKKVGKERQDKYYQLAKDQGYRARSAFKLIQLCKKENFLKDANVVVDLCGAPGGWSQVAAKHMADGKNNKLVCVDIVPLQPMPGVVGIQCDITTPKCRVVLRKALDNRLADVILNDGAPNVGANWAKDAFVQNELTLSATKLAAEFLRPNGIFVTKVFRSTDYTALIWVFHQLFWKVEQTKPSSSRAVSAEIFVICKGYKGNVNDPKLFDPEFVFMDPMESAKKAAAESGNSKLADLMKHQDKKKRGGYENDNTRKTESLVNFVKHPNPATLLMSCAELTIEDDESKQLLEGYYNRSFPEAELRECCKDLQLLGRGELTKLIKWRMKTRKEHQEREKEARKKEAARAAKEAEKAGEEGEGKGGKDSDEEDEKDSDDDAEMKELEKDAETNEELANMIKEMKQSEKRDLKKMRAQKLKAAWRKKMSMGTHFGGITAEPDLFQLPGQKEFSKIKGAERVDSDDEDSDEEGLPSYQIIEDEDEADRLANLEADEILAHREDAEREGAQARTRELKKKGETRRERKYKEWGAEMESFNAGLDQQVQTTFEKSQKLDDSDDDAEEGDDEDDSDDDMAAPTFGYNTEDVDEDGNVKKKSKSSKQSKRSNMEDGDSDGDSDDEMGDDSDDEMLDVGTKLSAADISKSNRWFDQGLFKGLMTETATGNLSSSSKAGESSSSKSGTKSETKSSTKSAKSSSSKKETASSSRKRQRDDDSDAEEEDSVDEALTAANESDSASDSDSEIKGLKDHELPDIPLCDKKKRQIKRRKMLAKKEAKDAKNAEKEAKLKAKNKAKKLKTSSAASVAASLLGGAGKAGNPSINMGNNNDSDDEDANNANVVKIDTSQFEIVEAPMDFDEENGDRLPGQLPEKQIPDHLKKPEDKEGLVAVQALGSMMIRKKERMKLLDSSYNRYNHDDEGLDLPEWFLEDENKHNKPELPATKEVMDAFRAKMKEINARPIRKVAEAGARKKKRLALRMEKVRSQAKMLAADPEMSAGAKARNMERIIKKAKREDNKPIAYQATKKAGGTKLASKGKMTKGAKVKVVDKRMKTDKRAEKRLMKNKKGRMAVKKKGGKGGKKGGKKGGGGAGPKVGKGGKSKKGQRKRR